MALSPPQLAHDGQDGEEQDTHFCLRCRRTIEGLDEYVQHRQTACAPLTAKAAPPAAEHRDDDHALKADDFFSQLELRSSAKTTAVRDVEPPPPPLAPTAAVVPATKPSGMLTRSKSSGRGSRRSVLERSPRGRKARRQDDDGEAEEDADGWRFPPRTHTGGKWRPQTPRLDDEVLSTTPPPDAGGKWGPPRTHTGGKWTPQTPSDVPDDDKEVLLTDAAPPPPNAGGKWGPPPTHTGGKWTPRAEPGEDEHCDEQDFPPPGHTRGKWAPGMANKVRALLEPSAPAAVRKSGSTVQYWCGSCNRRLASSKMYERHLQSELHSRRTLPERQLDMRPGRPGDMRPGDGPERPGFGLGAGDAAAPATPGRRQGRRRGHRQGLERCSVCRARVQRHQVGKHLVSHFHWRSTRSTAVGSAAAALILDNIEAVVRQSPFQCGLCKFYCNSSEAFRQHWASASHRLKDEQAAAADGQYWCSPCEVGAESSLDMEAHLWGEEHREVEAAVNRSVAVVVSRRTALRCKAAGCPAAFRYNAQLGRHERQSGHRGPGALPGLPSSSTPCASTAGDRYQCRYRCKGCGALRRSRLALQKHMLKCTSQTEGNYYCGVCSLNFPTAASAAQHRLGQAHRDAVRDRRLGRAGRATASGRPLRRCPHCREQCRGLAALRLHLDDKHPDRKHRCALCGLAFTLPQEVSRHHRDVHAAALAATPSGDAATGAALLLPAVGEQPPFSCRTCLFVTDSRAELVFHGVLHGPPELVAQPGHEVAEDGGGDAPDPAAARYRCPFCRRLYRKPALRTHLHVHTGERPFRCRHCDKGFSRKDSCVTHEVTAHVLVDRDGRDGGLEDDEHLQREEQRLQDAISSIVDDGAARTPPTVTASTAARPTRRTPTSGGADQRERKHLCDVCGKCFFNKATLRQHQVSLHGVKPLACSWPGCAVRARSAAELRSHLATHAQAAGQPAFQCTACPFRARTKQLLKRHEKIHTGEKAYKCEHCDFATRVGSHLLRHRRLHTGAKPFCCPHCSYRCNNLENLRKHVLQTNKHPGKSMYECRFCAEAGAGAFATNLATEFRGHLASEHGDVFRSAASAASFVAGIYDKEADTAAVVSETPVSGTVADGVVEGHVQSGGARAKTARKRRKDCKDAKQGVGATEAVLDLGLGPADPSMSVIAMPSVEEDLPTSLLPKHALLDSELFPLVVTDPDAAQDVVYVQLEDIDGGIVVVNA